MSDFGIKVSKGFYTPWSGDEKQLLHSGYPLLKLYAKGSGTLTKANGDTTETVTIAHSLGYTPQVFVFGEYIDYNDYPTATVVSRYKVFSFADTPGLQLWDFYYFYADNTNLYIKFTSNSYVATEIALDYTYYIFYDEQA